MQCAKLAADANCSYREEQRSISTSKVVLPVSDGKSMIEAFTDRVSAAFGVTPKVAPMSNYMITNTNGTDPNSANKRVRGNFFGSIITSIKMTVGRSASKKVLKGMASDDKFQLVMHHMKLLLIAEDKEIMRFHIARQGGDYKGYGKVDTESAATTMSNELDESGKLTKLSAKIKVSKPNLYIHTGHNDFSLERLPKTVSGLVEFNKKELVVFDEKAAQNAAKTAAAEAAADAAIVQEPTAPLVDYRAILRHGK